MKKYLIKLSDIKKSFGNGDNRIDVLNGISCLIREGEFVVIKGASGSGKTTLLHILGLIDLPTFGKYELQGENINSLDKTSQSKLRNQFFGFVFQQFHLIPSLNVIENVALPMRYTGKRNFVEYPKEILDRVGLSHRIDHPPTKLSGGEQQRVAIARALVNQPKILIADEPTGNLDSDTGKDILKIFKELNKQGISIILVTHDENIAKQGDRIISIKDGYAS